jgi:nitrite reductase/ring-hydroxylating ferredoxin subunit
VARDDAATRALLDRIRADAPVTRRDYLRILVTVSGGLLAGAAAVASGVFRRHGAGTAAAKKVADRLAPGEAVAFRYPGDDDRALAIRLPGGQLVAYSAVCTHLACAVLWRREHGELRCPCHDGAFDRPPARWSPGRRPGRCRRLCCARTTGASGPWGPSDDQRGDRRQATMAQALLGGRGGGELPPQG